MYTTSKFRPSMTNIHFDMPFAGYCLCSDGTGWGQNLYYDGGAGYDTSGDSINSWYNGEFSNYDTYGDAALIDIEATPPVYAPPPATPGAVYGHFTQTVWQVCCLSGRPGQMVPSAG